MPFDDELNHFKTGINLAEFAGNEGYCIDQKESSRHSIVMRHPDGDKIIIARKDGGSWIYFSVRDARDHGTIIDFLQNRGGGTLGTVRKRLREWTGTSRPVIQKSLFIRDLLPVSHNRTAVLEAWSRVRVCSSLPYLAGRGIGPDVLGLERFGGCVRVDLRNNALFPHYDREGLCGYEIKNKGFTGFAPGGIKGLWSSRTQAADNQLVLVESAIDAFSYHILQDGNRTRYASTGGELNTQQPALIREAIEKMPLSAFVLIAFDHDEGGEKIAQEVRAVIPSGRNARRVYPETGKDWNEMLQTRLSSVLNPLR